MLYLDAAHGHLINEALQATPYQCCELRGSHRRWLGPDS